MAKDPYEILGVQKTDNEAVIRSAYRKLAKRHHPDANGGSRDAEERLKTINLAYAAVRSRLGTESRVAATG